MGTRIDPHNIISSIVLPSCTRVLNAEWSFFLLCKQRGFGETECQTNHSKKTACRGIEVHLSDCPGEQACRHQTVFGLLVARLAVVSERLRALTHTFYTVTRTVSQSRVVSTRSRVRFRALTYDSAQLRAQLRAFADRFCTVTRTELAVTCSFYKVARPVTVRALTHVSVQLRAQFGADANRFYTVTRTAPRSYV